MMAAPTKVWMRLARRLGRDGNELRRRSDFIEACLVPAAIALFVIFVPLVAALTTFWVRADNSSVARAEVTWLKVPGVLLQSVPGPMEADHGADAWLEQARARWMWDGQPRVGYVQAAAGSTAITSMPRAASWHASVPVPQPTSSKLAGFQSLKNTASAASAPRTV